MYNGNITLLIAQTNELEEYTELGPFKTLINTFGFLQCFRKRTANVYSDLSTNVLLLFKLALCMCIPTWINQGSCDQKRLVHYNFYTSISCASQYCYFAFFQYVYTDFNSIFFFSTNYPFNTLYLNLMT